MKKILLILTLPLLMGAGCNTLAPAEKNPQPRELEKVVACRAYEDCKDYYCGEDDCFQPSCVGFSETTAGSCTCLAVCGVRRPD